jgi:hypothetical protein
MAILSLQQARVNSPILTSMAYGIPIQGFVGTSIMPMVPVLKRATKIITFANNQQKYLYATRRAPGDNITRIQTSYGDTEVSLYQDALEGELPIEIDEESEGIVDLQTEAISNVKIGLATRLEADIFSLVNNFAGYPVANRTALTALTQFSVGTVNPILAFDIANQAVLAGISRLPNTIIYGGLKAFNAVKNNPFIRDQVKYTTSTTPNLNTLNGILGYPTGKIATATYVNPLDPTTQIPFFDNSIWVGYVPGNGEMTTNPYDTSSTLQVLSGANKRVPSWGYTYTRMAAKVADRETGLVMDMPYYGENNRTWYFPGVIDRLPVVTGMAAGYLITNVAA